LRYLLIILITISGFIDTRSQTDSNKVILLIKSLGISSYDNSGDKDFATLDTLYKYHETSIKYLIDELTPVKAVSKITPEKYDQFKVQTHMIWCIRALRFITGIDLTSKTVHRFKKNEDERSCFLHSVDNEVSFFGVRMSHDVIFIAPKDAQINIIKKWKSWYEKNRGDIQLNKNPRLNDWYF
jgi:hypothetical protein